MFVSPIHLLPSFRVFPSYANEALHYILLLFAGLYSHPSAFAQPLQAPIHEPKVHISPKDGLIFWPMKLPVFVRLSTTEDPDGPSYLLKEANSKKSSTTKKEGSHEINLDISGSQFLRWYNVQSKDTLLLRFVADGNPPATKATFQGAQEFTNANKERFFGKGLQVSLASSDDHAGVEQIFVSIDRSPYAPYTSPLNFSPEKNVLLAFYAVDRVGNAEKVSVFEFMVDLSAPNTVHKVLGLNQSPVLSPEATIELSSSDTYAGVKEIVYKMDGGTETKYTNGKPISIKALTDGEHTLTYWAVDQVGNREVDKTYTFYLDKNPPEVSHTITIDYFNKGGKNIVGNRSRFDVKAVDNKSGVKVIHYFINGQENTYTEPFRLPSTEGEYQVGFRSTDNMDNVSKTVTVPYFLDLTTPKSSFKFDGISYTQRGFHWITAQTKLILQSSDAGAGVKAIYYTVNRNSTPVEYTEPIKFSDAGNYTILYYAIDQVSNREANQLIQIVVDTQAPEILVNFSNPSIGAEADASGAVLPVYPLGTQLYFAATDASSGLDNIKYSRNKEAIKEYTQQLLLADKGTFTYRIMATDRVKNVSEQTITFIVKE